MRNTQVPEIICLAVNVPSWSLEKKYIVLVDFGGELDKSLAHFSGHVSPH